jgi:hypothetical protein
MNKKTIIIKALVVMAAVAWLGPSASFLWPAAPEKLFDSNEIIDMTMEYDIKIFSRDRGAKRRYHKAKLSYTGPGGNTVTLDVRIKTRGKLRRTFLKCLVPAFKMKINKKQAAGTLFRGQKSLKLVTHCKNKPKRYEEYYVQEYLVYRTYNILSPISYRVRMANITYIDTNKKIETFTRPSFFIENDKKLAKRHKAKVTRVTQIPLIKTDYDTATMVSVFQYMIGNTDWSIRAGHNTIRLVSTVDKKIYPVPYDFDLAGIINADYARPDERIPIRSVRERFFRGHTKNLAQFYKIFAIFRKHKQEILNLYQTFPLLSNKLKQRSIKYIEGFYDIIKNPKLIKRYFIDNYRGRPLPKR